MQSKRDRRRALMLGVSLTLVSVFAPGTVTRAHGDADAAYDVLLARYVKPGSDGVTRVDYAAWRANSADRAALDAYITGLAGRRPLHYGT